MGALVYAVILFGTYFLGFNPLGRQYSPLQALFVPFVVGGSIAHFHYSTLGKRKILEMGVFGLGIAITGPLLYLMIFSLFLKAFPGTVDSYLLEAMEFLESNKEVYIRFSGEEEFALARQNLEKTGVGVILMDDLIKKVLIGFPFTILFMLLFFALPNYFRKKNSHGVK